MPQHRCSRTFLGPSTQPYVYHCDIATVKEWAGECFPYIQQRNTKKCNSKTTIAEALATAQPMLCPRAHPTLLSESFTLKPTFIIVFSLVKLHISRSAASRKTMDSCNCLPLPAALPRILWFVPRRNVDVNTAVVPDGTSW